MTIRNAKQSAYEHSIFGMFLRAHPSFASTVVLPPHQPAADFPDVIVSLIDGSQVDFELGEWVHEEQIGQGKRREQVVSTIERAIGEQGKNTSDHFRSVMLELRPDCQQLKSADMERFSAEFWGLIEETERRWPNEPFWHDPRGRHVRKFSSYPTLARYLSTVVFDPLLAGQTWRKTYPVDLPWIYVDSPGGAYSSSTALGALRTILQSKIAHYGRLSRTTDLIVYFNQAIVYNTSWYGPAVRGFGDVAAAAAHMVVGQSRFNRIYLLCAVEPQPEAYEIFPSLAKCEAAP